jgi:hypothetical protein
MARCGNKTCAWGRGGDVKPHRRRARGSFMSSTSPIMPTMRAISTATPPAPVTRILSAMCQTYWHETS